MTRSKQKSVYNRRKAMATSEPEDKSPGPFSCGSRLVLEWQKKRGFAPERKSSTFLGRRNLLRPTILRKCYIAVKVRQGRDEDGSLIATVDAIPRGHHPRMIAPQIAEQSRKINPACIFQLLRHRRQSNWIQAWGAPPADISEERAIDRDN